LRCGIAVWARRCFAAAAVCICILICGLHLHFLNTSERFREAVQKSNVSIQPAVLQKLFKYNQQNRLLFFIFNQKTELCFRWFVLPLFYFIYLISNFIF